MAPYRTKLSWSLLLIALSVSASNPPKQTGQVAEQVLAARQKMMQQDATAADVDAFLAFGTDNLVYEDPVAKMKIESRNQIRQGMLGFLGLSRHAHIIVIRRIAAANVVVLEQNVSFEAKQPDNTWKRQSRHQVTILEFEGLKIRRIADYWAR